MKNPLHVSLPRWLAPFAGPPIGALLGAQFGYRLRARSDVELGVETLAWFGAGLGLFLGLVVLIVDRAADSGRVSLYPSTLEGRVLAALAILTAWIPAIGLILAAMAWYYNRRTDEWFRPASRALFGIAVIYLGGLLLWDWLRQTLGLK